MKEESFKNKKGITLIALVVTIVVLLILAGITITALFSENGIIKKAQEAKNATEKDQTNTQEGLANLADQMAVQLGEDVSSLGKLIKGGNFVTEEQGHQKVTDKNGKTMYVPVGYKVTSDCNEIDKGVVIEDTNSNQFVWVPVPDVSKMYGVSSKDESTAKKYGKLYNFGKWNISTSKYDPLEKPIAENWTETDGVMTITYPSGIESYREPDVVTNYDNIASYYTNAGITDKEGNPITTADQFKVLLQKEFDEMIASVEEYKGFYIGRYETGGLSRTAVVQKGNTDIGNQNWYTMYNKSKNIKANNNVTTSMIWGCQWDATLTWMFNSTDPEVRKFVIDSTGKGNYKDTNENVPIPTGSKEKYSVNHIYDMARKCM